MNGKIVILTTESLHHTFYVRELLKFKKNISVYIENKTQHSQTLETMLPFEVDRERFEMNRWFGGVNRKIGQLLETKVFDSLNSDDAIESLSCEDASIVIAFGVGILDYKLIKLFPDRIFNLHGGDPEEYRGLDSHLWAIYHGEFSGLVTTLHRLSIGLDEGCIFMQSDLNLYPNMSLSGLRAINTEACVQMSILLISCMEIFGFIPTRQQRKKGRYYSRMPSSLKEICFNKFTSFIQKI